ncbi:hypothetical protein JCM11491_007190 [Sporobolomyces phaffii]
MQRDPELEGPGFKHATIREIYRLVQDPNTRVSAPALHLSSEYLKLFTAEAVHRAAEVAQLEQDAQAAATKKGKSAPSGIDDSPALLEVARQTKHLEKVLAGMLLDF